MHAVYERVFGLRPPYQIILDSVFLEVCLAHKHDFRTLLPAVLGGPVRLFTTQCILAELQARDSGAVFNARRLEVRRCPHTGAPRPGVECVREIIGSGNRHHYGVGAQDPELRTALRAVPGTPLLFANRTGLVLEDPSPATLRRAEELQSERSKVAQPELALLNRLIPVVSRPSETSGSREKKARGNPNPLSCLKKKKKTPDRTGPALRAQTDPKRPRTRRRHRPHKETPTDANVELHAV